MEHKTANGLDASAEDLAWAFLRAIQTRDWENIRPLLTDDYILEVPFNASGINDVTGGWRGVELVEANFKETWNDLVVVKYAEIEVVAGRDRNVAFAETLGDMKLSNGGKYCNRYVFRFDAENGKIYRIREYTNPVTAMISWKPGA